MPKLIFEFDRDGIDIPNRSIDLVAYSGEPVRSYRIDYETFEIIEVDEVIESWDLSRYIKAPVVMRAHDHSKLTVGRAENIETPGENGELKMRVVFDVDQAAEDVWRKYRDGFMFGFSVGFQYGTEVIEQGPERPLIKHRDVVLLELSSVNVGRDPGALVDTAGYKRAEYIVSDNAVSRVTSFAHIDPETGRTTEEGQDEQKKLSDAGRTLAAARKKKYQAGLEARQDAQRDPEMVRRFDRFHFLGKLSDCERLDSGAVRVPATLGRVGVLTYKLPGGKERRELRLPEEVFAERSISSLRGAPVTEKHMGGMVSPSTWREQSIGHTEVEQRQDDTDHINGSLVISDSVAIEKCDSGKLSDISPGYMCKLEHTPGTWNGVEYDAVQRNIVHNHVTLMPPGGGRQGEGVGLRLDADDAICVDDIEPVLVTNKPKELDMAGENTKTVIKVRLDGKEYEQGSDEHIGKIESMHAAEKKDLQDRMDAAEAKRDVDLKKVTDERDTVQAKLDAAEDAKKDLQAKLDAASNSEAVEKRVTERLELERQARLVFGDDVMVPKQDGKDGEQTDRLRGIADVEVMKECIRYDNKDFDFEGKSEAYIRARFDMLVETAEEAEETHQSKGLPSVIKNAEKNKQRLDSKDSSANNGPRNLPRQRWQEDMNGKTPSAN